MSMVCWDVETYPNYFFLGMEHVHSDYAVGFECSDFRDDSAEMFATLDMLAHEQVEMVGFNSLGFDYPCAHHIIGLRQYIENKRAAGFAVGPIVAKLAYEKAEQIIGSRDRFAHNIWANDRHIPQIDLFKVHHFDNMAKSTSLKVLQFAMRAPSVEDLPIEPGTNLTADEAAVTGRYCMHDISETKRFLRFSADMLAFRRSLVPQFGSEVLNWSDVKIGSEILIQRLGKEACYKYVDGKREPRQTPRHAIKVADIVFPTIRFETRECRDLLDRFKATTIYNTKAAVSDSIELGGFTIDFGTGGVHGSVDRQAFRASDTLAIVDADVTSLYPSIVIENGLSPEHLGGRVADIARDMRTERSKTTKGDTKNAALKLALNGGVFGKGNDPWSPMYDPQYAMTITINGQLLILKLCERLLTVPGLQFIQVNTDGVTCAIPPASRERYNEECRDWQNLTDLQLEFVDYSAMFIRDVNSYIAVDVKGKVKRKGAYDFPTLELPIGSAPSGPRAWHGDQSFMAIPKAADAALVRGVPVEIAIRDNCDPFDFMGRFKTPRGSKLLHGSQRQQRVTRYYRAVNAPALVKESPPPDHAYALPGAYKRKNGISEAEFQRVFRTLKPGEWDARIHTANKSVYGDRQMTIAASAGICNRAADFNWAAVDYEWYIAEATKLVDCFSED